MDPLRWAKESLWKKTKLRMGLHLNKFKTQLHSRAQFVHLDRPSKQSHFHPRNTHCLCCWFTCNIIREFVSKFTSCMLSSCNFVPSNPINDAIVHMGIKHYVNSGCFFFSGAFWQTVCGRIWTIKHEQNWDQFPGISAKLIMGIGGLTGRKLEDVFKSYLRQEMAQNLTQKLNFDMSFSNEISRKWLWVWTVEVDFNGSNAT